MSDIISKIKEDEADYNSICKLLNIQPQSNFYDHFEKLKKDPRIIFKNYQYQLKGTDELIRNTNNQNQH